MRPATTKLFFEPSARLQRYLGRELIADPNLAVIEFVKNSYDGGAASVLVRFTTDAEPTTLVIADDGIGMDLDEFEQNWMHPGFSTKAKGKSQARGSSAAAKRQRSRTPAGEKGLGRLAAGRLGDVMQVYTRRSKQDQWLHVSFDWSSFDDMDLSMSQVRIPHEFVDNFDERMHDVGTVVVIEGLEQDWAARVRGRPVPGRSRTRLGRLREDLELLIQPFVGARDFAIELDADWAGAREDLGTIEPATTIEDAGYRFDFAIEGKDGAPIVKRTVTRSATVAEEVAKPRVEKSRENVTADDERNDGHPLRFRCGTFSGTFFYNPPRAAKRAHQIERMTTGVLLYRDGILVEPFGLHGNDWVGASARKASRQGHAAIQPNTFSGSVLISRVENPGLRDQSNREGLLENEAGGDFVAHVRAEFREFDELVYNELVSQRWVESETRRAEDRAEESSELAVIRVRAVAHAIRQPLAGTATEMLTMRALAKRPGVPEKVRKWIDDATDRVDRHLERADALVERLATLGHPEFTRIDSAQLLRQAMSDVRSLAVDLGVQVKRGTLAEATILVPRELVFEGITELLRNGIEADRPDGLMPEVTVRSTADQRGVTVTITDNGTGIVGAKPRSGVPDAAPTRGRPGGGLAMAEVSITASRGRIALAATGSQGTTWEIWLPAKAPAKR
jgi:signal transduction histidine kinase